MQADHGKSIRLLKTARGQIDGIIKMIEADQYCVDIANQILASDAILRKVTQEILRAHMQGCLATALRSNDEKEQAQKLEEVMRLVEKMGK